jgi:hypothetical protein
MFALERPGASGDGGNYADRVELQNVRSRNVLPDFTGAYKYGGKPWGYLRVGGALRKLTWDDLNTDKFDLSGDAVGWGLNLTTGLNMGKHDVLRVAYVFGKGIENYMNDAPIDIGVQNNPSNPVTPVLGKPLPVQGLTIYVDHRWNDKTTSAIGYGREDIDNTDGQTADSFQTGQYASINVLRSPIPAMMFGGELQWGRRDNFNDGFHSDDVKLQFVFKYNFSLKVGP